MILALKRLAAYWLDFILLAVILIGFQWSLYTLSAGFPFDHLKTGYEIELWVLFTISIPVWLYFICSEYYYRQTVGKRLLKLRVESIDYSNISFSQCVCRTIIRLLPWELTHLIILVPNPWWGVDEVEHENLIYIPNALMLIYIIALFLSKGRSGVHDRLTRTIVREIGKVNQ